MALRSSLILHDEKMDFANTQNLKSVLYFDSNSRNTKDKRRSFVTAE